MPSGFVSLMAFWMGGGGVGSAKAKTVIAEGRKPKRAKRLLEQSQREDEEMASLATELSMRL